MGISSRARPARRTSRATSLMALPPRLLWAQKRSHSVRRQGEPPRAASSLPYGRHTAVLLSAKDLLCRSSPRNSSSP